MKKNIKPVLFSGALTLTTAKAARDEFEGGYENETKRHKIKRYLVGTGSAIGSALFGVVTLSFLVDEEYPY